MASLALWTTPCEMCRGAPSMMRKRSKASHRIHACYRFTRSQLSLCGRAQHCAAMATLKFVQFFSTMFQLTDSARAAEGTWAAPATLGSPRGHER
jgi:hypothetical protein